MDSGTDDDSSGRGDQDANPITTANWFQRIIAEPENLDVDALLDKARTYVGQVVGSRRPDESTGAHRTRAFADLLALCSENHTGGDTRDGNAATELYAVAAADTGHVDAAHRWYERLIVDGGGRHVDHWLLYGAFNARCGQSEEALRCARMAVAVDGQHRVALFGHAAALMASGAAVEHCDELETSLDRLRSAHPWYGEGHVLAALHWLRMEMPDRADRSLSRAQECTAADDSPQDRPLGTAWWHSHDRSLETDLTVRCATLLAALGLFDLATVCLRRFADQHDHAYHYLMAVLHHMRGEFDESAQHLRHVADDDDGRVSLLAAHNHYGRGCRAAAATVYAHLAARRPARQHFALAYARLAEHHVTSGRHAEAADVFRLACRVAKTPALLTSLAVSLVALHRHAEAEKLLAEAVAAEGPDDANAWHHLAVVNATTGWVDMADVCRRHADRLSSEHGSLPVDYRGSE